VQVKVTEADGSVSVSNVSKPITIDSTDDKGNKKIGDASRRRSQQPKRQVENAAGQRLPQGGRRDTDVQDGPADLQTTRSQSVPGAKKKSSVDKLPVPGGFDPRGVDWSDVASWAAR